MYTGLGAAGSLNNAQCRASALCSAVQDAWCYSAGYFSPSCEAWRSGLDAPPPVKAVIDSTPGSPTYGQVTVNGQVVNTPEDAQAMIDAQIAAQAEAERQTAFSNVNPPGWWSLGGAIPDSFAGQDFTTVALVVAAIAALSMMKG